MLAIIIPYYKLTFFEATLDSLAAQTNQNFKVYIGDDSSPESPNDLLEKYQRKFDFEYHRFEENLGGTSLTQQWERCIALSSNEEWVMILGDDDVLGKNVVAEFYNNLPKIKSENVNVVRFSTQKIDDEGKLISEIYYHPKIENAVDFLFRETRSSLSEYFFKNKNVLRIGFKNFPLGWFSDVLAVLEFSDFRNIFSINDEKIYVRVSKNSISGSQNNLHLKLKSTFEFYYYLLTIQGSRFSENQKRDLTLEISKCYLNDKKNIFLFFRISRLYLSNYWIKEYYGFIQTLFLNIVIHKNASRL